MHNKDVLELVHDIINGLINKSSNNYLPNKLILFRTLRINILLLV